MTSLGPWLLLVGFVIFGVVYSVGLLIHRFSTPLLILAIAAGLYRLFH